MLAWRDVAHQRRVLDSRQCLPGGSALRLHEKPQFITWAALKGQFGVDHSQMGKFKAVFRTALFQVLGCYPKAKVEEDRRGLTLGNSPPPVSARMSAVDQT